MEFFTSLLRAASFGMLPDKHGPYTLFLPADRAFTGVSGERLSALIHDPESLRALVTTHLVPGRVPAERLRSGEVVVSLSGTKIEPETDDELRVNGATVIATREFDGGIVHVIDRLL